MTPEELVMQQFALSLARIETKLDGLIADTGDHEIRIRAVEATAISRGTMWKAFTATTSLSMAVAAVIALFVR